MMEVEEPQTPLPVSPATATVDTNESGEEAAYPIPNDAMESGASHIGQLSELMWPELGGLDLTKVHRFPVPKTKRKQARTAKDEHYDFVIGKSPYGKFVGPNPIRPQITAAQIARKRMEKIYHHIGMTPPGQKNSPRKLTEGRSSGSAANPPAATAGQGAAAAVGLSVSDDDGGDNTMVDVEGFGLQTLQEWLAEVDSLRVALDRSLAREASTGEVSFPLLEDAPKAVVDSVKENTRAYQLPRYVHSSNEESPAEADTGETKEQAEPLATEESAAAAIKANQMVVGRDANVKTSGGALDPSGSRTPTARTRSFRTTTAAAVMEGTVSRTPPRTPAAATATMAAAGVGPAALTVSDITPERRPLTPTMRSSSGTSPLPSPKASRTGSLAASPAMNRGASGRRRRGEEDSTEQHRPSSRARLTNFLESLEAANVLSKDDVNSFFAPLPLSVSSEMDDQMKEILEKHLGSGPWQDVVGSTLARPLDSTMVYCDESAQLGTATIAPSLAAAADTPEGDGGGDNDGQARPSSVQGRVQVHTSLSGTIPILENFPRTEYLQRLAEEHRKEGRIQEAIACLQEASALLEQKEVLLPMSKPGLLFPYSNEVFRAARLIQRLGKRRLQHKHHSATVVAAHFRGFWVRRTKILLANKRQVASKIIQRKYRAHLRVLMRCATNIQRVYRGLRGRRRVALLRKEIKGAIVFQTLYRMYRAKMRVKHIRQSHECLVKVQSFWRGYYVRAMRYRQIYSLHEAWGRGITAITKHVRGWLARREARAAIWRKTRDEFDRVQAEHDVLHAAAQLAARRCHWYLQTAEGRVELHREEQRLRESGRFRTTTLAPFQLVDEDLLMDGLRHVFELFDLAGTGYVDRDELQSLISFLGVAKMQQEAETASALHLTDDDTGRWRRLDFHGFCRWYYEFFRYGPGHSTAVGVLHSLQRLQVSFARRSVMRRHCLTTARETAHRLRDLKRPPPFVCLQCRRAFLRYRSFTAHFVGQPDEAVKGPRHFCPATGGIGLIAIGYLGDRRAFDLQRRVNRELMRHADEVGVMRRVVLGAEAKTLADFDMPTPKAELQTLARGLQVTYPPGDLRRHAAKDMCKPLPLPGQLRPQLRSSIAHCTPRARRLGERINRQWGFNYLKRREAWRQQERERVRRRERATRLRRALHGLLSRRPCSKALVMAIFEVYQADEGGMDVRDLPDLFAALKLRFTLKAKAVLTSRALKATLAPGSLTRVTFDAFYGWYVASNGLLFMNGFDISAKDVPHYLAQRLVLRRSIVSARQQALTRFRQERMPRLDWSPSDLAVLEPHARRHPEFTPILPHVDSDMVRWIESSRQWVETKIDGYIKRWEPVRKPVPVWKRVLDRRRRGVAAASLSPTSQDACGSAIPPIAAEGLAVRQAEAEMRRYVKTVYGGNAVRQQVEQWQLEAWETMKTRTASSSCCGRGWRSLRSVFLQARREHAGIPVETKLEKQQQPQQATGLPQEPDMQVEPTEMPQEVETQVAKRQPLLRERLRELLAQVQARQRKRAEQQQRQHLLESMQRLVGLLPIHDPDAQEKLLWPTLPQLLTDLDLPADLPVITLAVLDSITDNPAPSCDPQQEPQALHTSDDVSIQTADLYRLLKHFVISGVPLKKRKRSFPDANVLTTARWWYDRAARSFVARARTAVHQSSTPGGLKNEPDRLRQLCTKAERDWLSQDIHHLTEREVAKAVLRRDEWVSLKGRMLSLKALRASYAKVVTAVGEPRRWWSVTYFFGLLDPARTGFIDSWQLGSLLSSLGYHLHGFDQALLLRSLLDPIGSGKVGLDDIQAWINGDDGRRHRTTLASRMLQLKRALIEALGLHVRGDAVYAIRMEALRDRERALRCLWAMGDGDPRALLDIVPWNRRHPVHYDRDLHSLLSLESASVADVLVFTQETELGKCLATTHREELRGRRHDLLEVSNTTPVKGLLAFRWLRSRLDFIRRPSAQHEAALAKHCHDVLGAGTCKGLGERAWLQEAGRRTGLKRLRRKAWTKEAIETALRTAASMTRRSPDAAVFTEDATAKDGDTTSLIPGLEELRGAKAISIVSPVKPSKLATLLWAYRVRATRLHVIWRHDEIQDFDANSRALRYEVAGLTPSLDDTDVCAREDARLRLVSSAQVRADLLFMMFVASFGGARKLVGMEDRVRADWGLMQAIEPAAHAFRLLEIHAAGGISATDLPLVLPFIYGKSKAATKLLHWVCSVVVACGLRERDRLSVPLLRSLCERGSLGPVVPSDGWIARQQTPRKFALLLARLSLRQEARDLVERATDGRLVDELFFQTQEFASRLRPSP